MPMSSTESPASPPATVLVTGGTGFVASHLILQLLDAGYIVRTTIRNLSRESEVRNLLRDAGAAADHLDQRLSFWAADLTKDDGWTEAVSGCTYVQHVASPFPSGPPKSENDLIIPARDGTLRVLRAARDAGTVRRVVLTSSFAAIGYGHPRRSDPFTEEDWSVLDGKVPIAVYHKSKTLPEKAAWEFIATEGGTLELTVINPVGILGPVLSKDFSASIQLVQKFLDGGMPLCPQLYFYVVDVRDLADLHIRAMTSPSANGERFIAASNDPPVSILDMSKTLRAGRPDAAKKAPTRQFPNWFLRMVGTFNSQVREMVPNLGEIRELRNRKAVEMLGWTPRSLEDMIVDTADSLVKYGVV